MTPAPPVGQNAGPEVRARRCALTGGKPETKIQKPKTERKDAMTAENKAEMIEALKLVIANWRAGWGNPITAAGRAVATKADFLAHFKAESLDAWPPEQDAQRAAEFIEARGEELWARMQKLDAEDEKTENYDWQHDPLGIGD